MMRRAVRPLLFALVALLALGITACGKGAKAGSAAQPAAGAQPVATQAPTKEAPLRAGERFESLTMAAPYTPVPPHGGTDEYRCFLVDPKLAAPAFLTGSLFQPQNAAIVHHAIIYRVGAADVGQAKALDAADPGDGWTCFGGSGVRSTGGTGFDGWIGAWAPGATETLFTAKVGYQLAAGDQLVLQVHYNLLATAGKAPGPDQSGIRLRLTDAASALTPLQTTLVAAPIELPCPAAESGPLCDRTAAINDLAQRFGNEARSMVTGLNLLCNGGKPPVAGDTQHCDQTVRQAGLVYAVGGHMHLLGRSIKVELNPGTAKAQTLLDLPIYNFDDQAARPLVTPAAIRPGDTLRVTCTYDASLRAKLPQLKPLKPRYVVWGDGTSDEMCLGIVIWAKA
jgi:Copper type II ascorbate-dependent monooxygenase, C-terminal domain